jgi:hypothetical protein
MHCLLLVDEEDGSKLRSHVVELLSCDTA